MKRTDRVKLADAIEVLENIESDNGELGIETAIYILYGILDELKEN